jgi:hypothetical protein
MNLFGRRSVKSLRNLKEIDSEWHLIEDISKFVKNGSEVE